MYRCGGVHSCRVGGSFHGNVLLSADFSFVVIVQVDITVPLICLYAALVLEVEEDVLCSPIFIVPTCVKGLGGKRYEESPYQRARLLLLQHNTS